MKILILNGPNLNMLGKRNPAQYGSDSLEQIEAYIKNSCPEHEFIFKQSNKEGGLIDAIQSLRDSNFDALIANFGGYSHTSVAIRDALELIEMPFVEVHLSNVYGREPFRHQALTAAMAEGVIAGFGKNSYILAVKALVELEHENLKK